MPAATMPSVTTGTGLVFPDLNPFRLGAPDRDLGGAADTYMQRAAECCTAQDQNGLAWDQPERFEPNLEAVLHLGAVTIDYVDDCFVPGVEIS